MSDDRPFGVLADALATAVAARHVLVVGGETHDWCVSADGSPVRMLEHLAMLAARHGLATVVYRLGTPPEALVPPGSTELRDPLPSVTHPAGAILALCRAAVDSAQPLLVVVDGIDNVLPEQPSAYDRSGPHVLDAIQRLATSSEYFGSSSLVVLVERQRPVDRRIRLAPGVETTEICLPSARDRLTMLRCLGTDVDACDAGAGLAAASAGLRLDEISAAWATRRATVPTDLAAALQALRRRRLAALGIETIDHCSPRRWETAVQSMTEFLRDRGVAPIVMLDDEGASHRDVVDLTGAWSRRLGRMGCSIDALDVLMAEPAATRRLATIAPAALAVRSLSPALADPGRYGRLLDWLAQAGVTVLSNDHAAGNLPSVCGIDLFVHQLEA